MSRDYYMPTYELNLEALSDVDDLPGDEDLGGDPYEEMQMKAEIKELRERQKNKSLRHRQSDWY